MAAKSSVHVVLRNAAFVTGASVLSQVITGVTSLLIIRYLGLSLYSEYSTAMFFMSAFTVFSRLGFNRVFLRDASQDTQSTPYYFGAALCLNTILTLAAFAAALVIAYLRYDSRIFQLTVILGVSFLLQGWVQTPRTVFQVHQKLHFMAIAVIVCSIFYFFAALMGIYLGVSVFLIAWANLAMSILGAILSCSFSFYLSWPRWNFVVVKRMLKTGMNFCGIDLTMLAYTQSHGFILAIFNMEEQVGIFGVPSRIYAVLQMIAQLADTAISPALYSAAKTPERMIRGIKLVIRYVTISGLYICAVLIGRGKWITVTLFKEEFIKAVPLMYLFGLVIACRFIVILFSHVLYSQDKERFMLIAMSVVAVFTIIACLIVVPLYGAMGATIVLLAGEAALCLVCLIKSSQLFPNAGFGRLFLLPICASVITGLFFFFTKQWQCVSLLCSPLVFFGFLWASGYYNLAEFLNLLGAFKSNDKKEVLKEIL